MLVPSRKVITWVDGDLVKRDGEMFTWLGKVMPSAAGETVWLSYRTATGYVRAIVSLGPVLESKGRLKVYDHLVDFTTSHRVGLNREQWFGFQDAVDEAVVLLTNRKEDAEAEAAVAAKAKGKRAESAPAPATGKTLLQLAFEIEDTGDAQPPRQL